MSSDHLIVILSFFFFSQTQENPSSIHIPHACFLFRKIPLKLFFAGARTQDTMNKNKHKPIPKFRLGKLKTTPIDLHKNAELLI